MRKVLVLEWMSLDGVVQAPAYADEDTSGGFEHGGWHLRYFEEHSMKWVVENVSRAGGFLLGRRTYDVFAAHWPNASPEEQAFAQPMNTLPKYVASRTLREPLAWQNSRLIEGDVAESVAALKREAGDDLLVIGSTELAATLLEHDLVDELRLMIDPVLLGGGKRFFRDDGVCRRFTLVTGETTRTGAILATYARSGAESTDRPQRLPRPPARMAADDDLGLQRLYHGTKADLRPGDLIEAGYESNYGKRKKAAWVYLTATLDAATWGAELAVGAGPGRIYIVEPTGPIADDPNLTDKKFPGNPTKSYRSRDPLRVTGEVTDWKGHSPEQLQAMKDSIERLRQLGVEAIED